MCQNLTSKYNEIGTGYNRTRSADAYLTGRFYSLLRPPHAGKNLDIGCGTGNYAIALQNQGVNFVGIDPSEHMLDVARYRNNSIDWRLGAAEAVPALDGEFENAIAMLTIHHWSDRQKAFGEINRVLKPGGRFVIFTSCPDQMQHYWLNHYFPRMMAASMCQMPTIEDLISDLKYFGFRLIETEKYDVRNDLTDFFLYAGKPRPTLYLEPAFRRGISSFSSLISLTELTTGLRQLEKDIVTGDITRICEKYQSGAGDYMFIIAQKKPTAIEGSPFTS